MLRHLNNPQSSVPALPNKAKCPNHMYNWGHVYKVTCLNSYLDWAPSPKLLIVYIQLLQNHFKGKTTINPKIQNTHMRCLRCVFSLPRVVCDFCPLRGVFLSMHQAYSYTLSIIATWWSTTSACLSLALLCCVFFCFVKCMNLINH